MKRKARNMNMKKLMALVSAAFMCLAVVGETYTDGNGLVWTYSVSKETDAATLSAVSRADGKALAGALVIPSSVNGKTVTTIASDSFTGLQITSLSFDEGVKVINAGAFANCTSLETLTLPNSLTTLRGSSSTGNGAFAGCSALKSVNLGNGFVTITDGYSNAVNNGANTKTPDTYANTGVLGNCLNLEEVFFSPNIKKIGAHAFSECVNLKEVNLPDSLQSIGENAFHHNKSLATASFGLALATIGENAFYNCPELQTVEFRPCSTPLLTIGANAFAFAIKLTSLSFSESLKVIGAGAFANCTSLETLTLPNSLTTLHGNSSTGNGAFAGCSALKSVILGSGLVTITDGYSNAVNNGANTKNPDTYANTGVFGKCLNLEDVSFGTHIEKIGAHAFSECQAIKTLTFPDSLQFIGENGFYNNMRLTSVTFGADIRSIGKYAFMGCVSLKKVAFSPSTYPTLVIAASAFSNCKQLSSLTLPDALTTLDDGAFAGCTLLRNLTMPSIVSTVSDNVFADMGDLKEVSFLGLPPENLENAGLKKDVKIRYSNEYAEDWANVVTTCGFTNASGYDSESLKPPAPEIDPEIIEHRYALTSAQADRAIASITVNADCAIDSFVLVNGMVYDSVIYIKNTTSTAVKLTLPTGFTYKALKGTTPMTIPANTENILTITRIADNTFLVSREELVAAQ